MPREGETAGKAGPSWDHGRPRPAACRALSAFVRAAHRGPLPEGRSVLVLERSKSTVPTAPPLAPRARRGHRSRLLVATDISKTKLTDCSEMDSHAFSACFSNKPVVMVTLLKQDATWFTDPEN